MLLRICQSLILVAGAIACGSQSPPVKKQPAAASSPEPEAKSALADEAVAGVTDSSLKSLLADHWEWRMQRSPVWATTLGDHRFDNKIEDNSQSAIDSQRAMRREFLDRARAIEASALSYNDRTTRSLFIEQFEHNIATEVCEMHQWSISARGNPITSFNVLPERHKVKIYKDATNLMARYEQIARSVDNSIEHLKAGAKKGMFANAESVRLTIEMIDSQLAKPMTEWALLRPVLDVSVYDGWTKPQRREFRGSLMTTVDESIKPAFARYRDVLRDQILPSARTGNKVGVGALPQGADCYEARVRSYIGIDRTPKELYDLGLVEIKKINGEMKILGRKLFRSRKLSTIIKRLRTDKKLYFENREQILEAANAALAASREKMGEYFGILPQADCVVVEIPDYEAKYTTIAYYRQPHFDGSKPGEYFINTYKPEVRPRYEMQVLAFHEAIPGHHLQISISQERGELPAFRRFSGITAYVEGWALYTERLGDEMGLYTGDLDRMGMLSYDAWRAVRLVVDTGIHEFGWTRARAEKYMLEHTALTEDNIRNEVDRYITWPGQALAYKVGQLEILKLRALAREELGDQFDIKAFHDAVLANGAVSLPVLADQIDRYLEQATRNKSAPRE